MLRPLRAVTAFPESRYVCVTETAEQSRAADRRLQESVVFMGDPFFDYQSSMMRLLRLMSFGSLLTVATCPSVYAVFHPGAP